MQKSSPNTTTAPTGQIAPFGLRMLPELRSQVEEAARVSGRSMNAEIVARLQASFGVKTLDNLAMFAKPASGPAGPTELVHPGLSRIAAEEYAAALLSHKKELQAMVDSVISPYLHELRETIERDRDKWNAYVHTGVRPVEVSTQNAPALPKTKGPR